MYSVQVTFSHYFCWGGGGWGIVIRVKGADRVKGEEGEHPPLPPSWAENTIMTECAQESGHRQFIYSLVCDNIKLT
jgi:hypothetical protein